MKKKICSIFLAIIFMFAFSACSLNVSVPELKLPEDSKTVTFSNDKDKEQSNPSEGENKNSTENTGDNTSKENQSQESKVDGGASGSENANKNAEKNEASKNNNTENSGKNETSNTCTITIRCDTAINTGVNKKPEFSHLPSNGVILPVTTMEIKDGDTVYDILQRMVIDKKIHMEYTGVGSTIYIEGIDNLYEFDGGRWSGWMYCVNDWYPNYGCGSYKVKPGDVIQWNYTCDLGEDLGQHWLGEDIRETEK